MGQRFTSLFTADATHAYHRPTQARPTLLEKPEFILKTGLPIEKSFEGRKVIVTGGSGSIGSEVIKILLNNGATVVVLGRSKDNLKYLDKYKNQEGKSLFRYVVDFSMHPLDLESKFREAMHDLHGELHSLIVCHGTPTKGSVRTLNLKEWDKCMLVNVRSVFMIVSLAVPFLKLNKEEDPSVCILTANAGKVPVPGFTAFSVAKAMIYSFIECAALEMAYHNIRINGVSTSLSSNAFKKVTGEINMKKSTPDTFYMNEAHLPLAMHPKTYRELEDIEEAKVPEPRDIADSITWL